MNRAICVQFFISGANGIAKHSGEKSFAGVHPSPFYQKVLDSQKDNIQMCFFLEYSTSFDTSVISL